MKYVLFLPRKTADIFRSVFAALGDDAVIEHHSNAESEPDREWPGYWYHRRLQARAIRPVCQIEYQRTARVAMTSQGPIRFTLDDEVRAVPVTGLSFSEENGTLLLENQVILELKFRTSMPALFKQLAGEFGLEPQPVSKYRLAAVALGFVPAPAQNGSANVCRSVAIV